MEVRDTAHIQRVLCASSNVKVAMASKEDAVRQAQVATTALFTHTRQHAFEVGNSIAAADVIEALGSDPKLKTVTKEVMAGTPITKLAADYGLTSSRGSFFFHQLFSPLPFYVCATTHSASPGEARKLLQSGGFYLNNEKISQDRVLGVTDIVDGRMAILRAGKDRHIVLVQSLDEANDAPH